MSVLATIGNTIAATVPVGSNGTSSAAVGTADVVNATEPKPQGPTSEVNGTVATATATGAADGKEATTVIISVETVKPTYSRDEYFLMTFLPIIVVLCLIITAFAFCKFYAARRQKLLKKQQYFERLVQFPWTLLTHA